MTEKCMRCSAAVYAVWHTVCHPYAWTEGRSMSWQRHLAGRKQGGSALHDKCLLGSVGMLSHTYDTGWWSQRCLQPQWDPCMLQPPSLSSCWKVSRT